MGVVPSFEPLNLYQECWSARIINSCSDTGNRAVVGQFIVGGVVSNIKVNRVPYVRTLLYLIGRETEHLICVTSVRSKLEVLQPAQDSNIYRSLSGVYVHSQE